MAYHSKYTGAEVDALLDKVESGDVGGKVTVDSALSTVSENPVMNRVITEELEYHNMLIEDLYDTKIDKEADDYYPQLSVGVADNLAGVDVVASDFVFRRSGGGAISDGVARVESIKGNSVVWNQLFNKGVNTSSEVWVNNLITINVNNTSKYQKFDNNADAKRGIITHKYLQRVTKVSGSVLQGLLKWYSYAYGTAANVDSNTPNGVIFEYIGSPVYDNAYWSYRDYSEGTTAEELVIRQEIYDLTQMFGAGNEPTTIEEYYRRKPIVEDEYAYNEGEIIDMRAEGIKSVGRNAWDEEWERGSYSSNDGKPVVNEKNVRCKNAIAVLPNMTYHFKIPISSSLTDKSYMGFASFYDSEDVFIRRLPMGGTYYANVLTPTNARYMRFFLRTEYGATYNHDICINLSDTSFNGQYEPHIEASEDLSIVAKYFPNGMRSAGTAHDEIRYNKQTNKWEAVKRIGEVDLGTLDWVATDHNRLYSTGLKSTLKPNAGVINAISSRFIAATSSDVYNNIQDRIIATNEGGVLTIYDSAYIDNPSGFKAAMSGVMLYYELETPIVTEITADIVENPDFNLDYLVQNCGTEQMIATEPSSAIKADITYGFNAVGLIKQLRSMIEALSAKVANL